MSTPIRVIICDDDALARTTMAAYLATADDITIVSLHDNATDALTAVAEHQPDVLLSDIRMPGLDGITATTQLATLGLSTRVLLITSYDDTNTLAALQSGAAGYVLKTVTPAALVDAVRAVHRGLAVISAGPMGDLLPHATNAADTPMLGPEERTALKLLCQGMSNHDIAQAMYVSESTIKRHLTSTMRALGTTSRLTTVLEAQRLGLDH